MHESITLKFNILNHRSSTRKNIRATCVIDYKSRWPLYNINMFFIFFFIFKYRSRRLPGVWFIEKSIPDDIVLTHLCGITLIGCFLIFNNHFSMHWSLFLHCHAWFSIIFSSYFARMIWSEKINTRITHVGDTITLVNKPNLKYWFHARITDRVMIL